MQRAVARAKARQRRERGLEEKDKEKDGGAEEENWEAVEPMEVLEGGGSGGDSSAEGKFGELDQFSADNPSALR